MAFSTDETVLIKPKVDLGTIKEIRPENFFNVECFTRKETEIHPEQDLRKEPLGAFRYRNSRSFFWIVRVVIDSGGEKKLERNAYTNSGSRIRHV